jgi:hypothetical protein
MRFSKNFSELSDQQLERMIRCKLLCYFVPSSKGEDTTVYVFEPQELKKELTIRALKAI